MPAQDPLITQAKADGKPEIILIEFHFAQGTLYLCDQVFDFDYNGNTYLGSGLLLKTNKLKSTVALSNLSKKYELSGADQALVAAIMGATQINREVIQYRVYLDVNPVAGYTIIASPELEWQGIITGIKASSDIKKPRVYIETGTIFSDFDRRVNRSTTPASQQAHFPLDTGMRFASETNKKIRWGYE